MIKMKNTQITPKTIFLFFIFFVSIYTGFMYSVSIGAKANGVLAQNVPDQSTEQVKGPDGSFPRDVYDDDVGVLIDKDANYLFDIKDQYLFYYKTINNGTIYYVDLNDSSLTPYVYAHDVGTDVNDMAVFEDGTLGGLLRSVVVARDSGLYKLRPSNTWTKLASGQIEAVEALKTNFWPEYVYRTSSGDVYYLYEDDPAKLVLHNFNDVLSYSVEKTIWIDQVGSHTYILIYNKSDMFLYNVTSSSMAFHYKTTTGYEYTVAVMDLYHNQILYNIENGNDDNSDGVIWKRNIFTQNSEKVYDHSNLCIGIVPGYNSIYFLEKGYWGGESWLHFISYDLSYHSWVSSTKSFPHKLRVMLSPQNFPYKRTAVYYNPDVVYHGIYAVDAFDLVAPTKPIWNEINGTITSEKTVTLDWQSSTDFNDVHYEVSMYSVYDNGNKAWEASKYTNSTSITFNLPVNDNSDTKYEYFFFKIYVNDSMQVSTAINPVVNENVSDFLNVTYENPYYEEPAENEENSRKIPGFPMFTMLPIILGIISVISCKMWKKHLN